MNVDLDRLRQDIDTATPHQIPTWRDNITDEEFEAVCARAEQLTKSLRVMRAVMRKPGS